MSSRIVLRPLSLVLLAALAACSSDTDTSSPTKSAEAAPEVTVDLAAAALPTADQLPAGFRFDSRCPGDDYCSAPKDAELLRVAAVPTGDSPDPVWGSGGLWLEFTIHQDTAGADRAMDAALKQAKQRDGDPYTIKAKGDTSSFTPGEQGTGSYADHEIGDWKGIESVSEYTYNGPISDKPSSPRQGSRLTLAHDNVRLECLSLRLASAGKNMAKTDCRTAAQDIVDRLSKLDPDEVERVLTPRRLGEAFPAGADFPKGSAVRRNCPLAEPCEDDESYDASLLVNTTLPEGVAPAGQDNYDRYRIKGGEWSEEFELEVTLKESEKVARREVATLRKAYRERVGAVDTAPVKTETGYDYGIHGTGTFVKLGGDSWDGALRVYDATLEHLDGRIGDRRYYINFSANSGAVMVKGLANLTPQGRTQREAIGFVREQVERYFARLSAD